MYDMPLNDAILLENGAVTRVNRIVRAIEYTSTLANKYKTKGLTPDLIASAEIVASDKSAGYRAQRASRAKLPDGKRAGKSPFAERLAKDTAWGAAKTRQVKLDYSAKFAIAKFLRIEGAYVRGVLAKRHNLYGKSGSVKRGKSGQPTGFIGVGTGKGRFGGRPTQLKAAARTSLGYAGRGFYAFSDDAQKAEHEAYRDLKKTLRTKDFPGKQKTAAYYEALAALRTKAVRAPRYNESALMGPNGPIHMGREAHTSRAASSRARKAAAKQTRAFRKAAIDNQNEYTAGHANPFGYDDLALVTNPSGIGILDSVESSMSNIPVVKYLAPVVTPVAMGAAAFGAHFFLTPYVEKGLNTYLPAAAPFAYTITGVTAAAGCAGVAMYSKDTTVQNAAALLGGAAVSIGVALDLFRKYGQRTLAGDSDFGALALTNPGVFGGVGSGSGEEFGALALTNPGVFGALALTNPGVFGDGMAYQLGPVGGLGFDSASNAVLSGYHSASMADAYFSGPDFDAVEGEALLSGPAEFRRVAGAPPHAAAGAQRHQSNLAGRRFHRWAWLIKLIGFDNAQKIAALSPEERVKVIDAMRKQALSAYQQTMASHMKSQSALSVGPGGFGPMAPTGAAAAPGVGDALGYGALAVADF